MFNSNPKPQYKPSAALFLQNKQGTNYVWHESDFSKVPRTMLNLEINDGVDRKVHPLQFFVQDQHCKNPETQQACFTEIKDGWARITFKLDVERPLFKISLSSEEFAALMGTTELPAPSSDMPDELPDTSQLPPDCPF